ncbi:hypothetical protein MCHI_000331 [Candidatus Magnetoovum chiemensis]|nr:hypothetical protein MCHI_000331 [Candidatus Magnetoovum chiemensis]
MAEENSTREHNITYCVGKMSPVTFEPFTCTADKPMKMELTFRMADEQKDGDKGLRIEVTCERKPSVEEKEEIGKLIEQNVDIFSYYTNWDLDKAVGDGHLSLPPITVEATVINHGGELDKETLDKTKRLIENNCKGLSDSYIVLLRIYRTALGLNDAVSSFMLLYLILSIVCGDNQDKVDECILKIKPNTPTRPKPRKSGKNPNETCYTRLRNEIGHNRDAEINKTITDMGSRLEDFRDIVREIIKQEIT